MRAVSLQPLTSKVRVQSQTSPCGICGAKSGTFDLPLSISFHQCATPIHSFILLLLLSEGQVSTVCDPSYTRKHQIEMILHVFRVTLAPRGSHTPVLKAAVAPAQNDIPWRPWRQLSSPYNILYRPQVFKKTHSFVLQAITPWGGIAQSVYWMCCRLEHPGFNSWQGQNIFSSEFSGFHSIAFQDSCLLLCNAMSMVPDFLNEHNASWPMTNPSKGQDPTPNDDASHP